MLRSILASIVIGLMGSAGAVESERFTLKGTIAPSHADDEQSGVAMLEDSMTRKTLFLRAGQRLPGSDLVLVSVARKHVLLRSGTKEKKLFRDAWDGESSPSESSNKYAASGTVRSAQAYNNEYRDDYGDDQDTGQRRFTAPPPLPPPVHLDDDDHVPDYSDSVGGGGLPEYLEAYPVDDDLEVAPGIYPE